MIDTLALAEALEKKGFQRDQAEGLAHALRESLDAAKPLTEPVFEAKLDVALTITRSELANRLDVTKSDLKVAMSALETRILRLMLAQTLVLIGAMVAVKLI